MKTYRVTITAEHPIGKVVLSKTKSYKVNNMIEVLADLDFTQVFDLKNLPVDTVIDFKLEELKTTVLRIHGRESVSEMLKQM